MSEQVEKEVKPSFKTLVKKNRGGNPNLKPGVRPYNIQRGSFRRWLEDHPSYETKVRRPSGEIVRRFLEEAVTTRHTPARLEGEGEERLHKVLKALYRTSINEKSRNQVMAAQLMLLYAYGKPQSSDADLDAIKRGGLTVVYVNRPAIDPDIPVAQQALPEKAPEFIDAQVVEE